jgi:hypothetical protein
MARNERTSKRVGSIASKVMRGKRVTKKNVKSLAASALTQVAPAVPEEPFASHKCWVLLDVNNRYVGTVTDKEQWKFRLAPGDHWIRGRAMWRKPKRVRH